MTDALRFIAGHTHDTPSYWLDLYRQQGGGYEGLQAVAEAALLPEKKRPHVLSAYCWCQPRVRETRGTLRSEALMPPDPSATDLAATVREGWMATLQGGVSSSRMQKEGHAALNALVARCEQLERERDEAQLIALERCPCGNERRVAELEAALRSIDVGVGLTAVEMRDRARAALEGGSQ